MNERRVVVTGAGVVSPFGAGRDIFWNNIREGNSAASLIKTFDASELPVKFFAPVPVSENDLDELIEDKKSLKTMCRAAKLAMIAADEAVKDSGIDTSSVDPYKFGTSLGASGIGYWDVEFTKLFLGLILGGSEQETVRDLNQSKIWNHILKNLSPLTPLKALSNIATAHIAIKYNAKRKLSDCHNCLHFIRSGNR
ncbi:MAG: hypothetical protein IPL53_14945 [Ignavibacteria bacterium]|nr:hypothetical protein [Ignavibacteria bacterium]